MTKGVITYYNGTRFVDRISMLAHKIHLFKTHFVWHIAEDATDRVVGGFYGITGWKPVVRFFEWLTQDRSKNCHDVVIHW